MRLGLPISLLLHALILAWGLIAMKSTRDFKKIDPQPIALEIITEGELAQMRKGDEKSKEKELEAAKDSQTQAQKETPKPKPVAAQPPPPPPPPEPVKEEPKPEDVLKEMAKTEPKPPEPKPPEPPLPPKEEPKPDDILKEMAKAEPKPAPPPPPPKPPDPPPKAAEKPKPTPPKPKPLPKVAVTKPVQTPPVKTGNKPSTFDPQQIAALIDKSPNAAPAPASTASAAPMQKSRTAAGIRDGQGPKLSQNEQQALAGRLVAQIKRCWRPPTGIPDAKSAIPVIAFKLQRDGSVAGAPSVVNRQGSASFQLASESATRAIMQCQPYDMPADKYDGGWSEVELEFDPSTMFGG